MSRPGPAPGPELDVLIAERVMGWTEASCRSLLRHVRGSFYRPGPAQGGVYLLSGPWSPSTDIRAAWDVLEHLAWGLAPRKILLHRLKGCMEGWRVTLCEVPGPNVLYGIIEGPIGCESAPHAICLAALKAAEEADDEL